MKENFDLVGWLTIVVWPALLALVTYQVRTRTSLSKEVASTQKELAELKLHVAEDYVSRASLKETEERILRHLERIEKNLAELARNSREGR